MRNLVTITPTRRFMRWLPLLALLGLLGGSLALGQDATPLPTDRAGLTAALAQNNARIATHARTDQVRFIGAEGGRAIPQPQALPPGATREQAARGFLRGYGPLFGLASPDQELTVLREAAADRGRAFVRFQQVYNAVPVFGGELIVQLDAANNVLSASGEVLPALTLATTPAITAEQAAQTARDLVVKQYGVAPGDLNVSAPELWIYDPALVGPDTGTPRLVWRTEVTPLELQPIRELVLVDAQRGSVALNFNQIHNALDRETYTANNGTTLPGTLVCDEANPTCAGGDAHEVAAHVYAGHTYNYFSTVLGRDSIDDAGMTLISTVHFGVAYVNAFWNGQQMVYGDGAGFALADDVVAHELTHGVTEFSANLFYYYQSGAINESMSDVFGEFVDLTNGVGTDTAGVRWLMGEDVTGLGAIRNMANPPAFGDPDRIGSPLYYEGALDGGGVHSNSGVNNKAAYLMVDGGSFNGRSVSAIGITKTALIYYEVLTNLLTSGSDYADLYEALYQGCQNLIGTGGITMNDCDQVRKATDAVEMNKQPAANFNTDAPFCPTGQTVNQTLFFDDLESGSGSWVTGAIIGGPTRWGLGSTFFQFAHSGVNFIYGDDFPDDISDTFVAMNASVLLPANAYLHFAHAYGFENPNWDGGVLEYSTNGGTTWLDTNSLFEVNGYDGTLNGAFGNPLGGRRAFLGDSHGYISSRLRLASLAGQSVRFRWRLATDSSAYDLGWFLDDVRIYSCVAYSMPPQRNYFTTSDPVLTWAHMTGVTTFTIQVATNSAFTANLQTFDGIAGSATSHTLSGLSDGVYYWRIRGVYGSRIGSWSAVEPFTVDE